LGLVVVAIFQIVAIFFMLNFYDKLVSNPDNYYKNILVRQDKLNLKAIEDAALPTID
jgi:hypothetical protein